MPSAIQKQYSRERANVSALTVAPNAVRIGFMKMRYTAVSTTLTMSVSTMALPTLRCACSCSPAPRRMLT